MPAVPRDFVSFGAFAFEPVPACEWRNSTLDFQNLPSLLRSLALPSPREGLVRAQESVDEFSLKKLAENETVRVRCRDRSNLIRLWDVCQTPDFRKSAGEDHLRLVGDIYDHLTRRDRRLPEDWMAGQFDPLDRADGDIDALQGRLSYVRTLAYIANRPDWVRDPAHWQGRTRALEDRLSDTLHERLMARFVDRRTSVLLRSLGDREELEAKVAPDGVVQVQGQFVGRLRGLAFEADKGGTTLEEKALRAAAQRAVGPEVVRRLGRLAAEPDEAFAFSPDGLVLWRGEAAGVLEASRLFAPKVRLLGELGPDAARERAQRRLEAFLSAEASRLLQPLRRLEAAIADGQLKGLARGLAWRLAEAGGVIDRALVAPDVAALSQVERRALKSLGVRFGAFSLFLPALLRSEALAFTRAFAQAAPTDRALAARGLRAVDRFAVPVEQLEALDAILREQTPKEGGSVLPPDAAGRLGWEPQQLEAILRGLGFAPARKPVAGQASIWRRRRTAHKPAAPARPLSPFAALAALTEPAPRKRRPRRRKPRQAAS